MHTYHFFGLHIKSAIPFPGSEEKGIDGDPDVVIEFGPAAQTQNGDIDPSTIWGRYFDFFHFNILDGRRIVIDVKERIPDHELSQVLTGELMAALLRQRGLLVLHACGVARDGSAIGFLGDSGWGKSTIAEYFCQNGYGLVTDDILAIDVNEPSPIAYPGYPDIKLREEAGDHLRVDFEHLPTVVPNEPRRASNRADTLLSHPVEIRKLYVLQNQVAPQLGIVSLTSSEHLIELVRHTRSKNLLTGPESGSQHLQQCKALLEKVPVSVLERIKSLDSLPQILELIERDLA